MWLSRKEFNPSGGRFCVFSPALGAGFGEALQWFGDPRGCLPTAMEDGDTVEGIKLRRCFSRGKPQGRRISSQALPDQGDKTGHG